MAGLVRTVVHVVHWTKGVSVGALTKLCVLVQVILSRPWKQECNDLGKEGDVLTRWTQ